MKSSDFVFNGQTQLREPGSHPHDSRGWVAAHSNGMSKREYFAAMALQGLVTRAIKKDEQVAPLNVADLAVRLADALIAELAK